jgi:hypothetical protein
MTRRGAPVAIRTNEKWAAMGGLLCAEALALVGFIKVRGQSFAFAFKLSDPVD